MIRPSPISFALAAATLLVSGCASDQHRYPSLARRASERMGGTLAAPDSPVAAPSAASPGDPARDSQLARLLARAAAAEALFAQKLPAARRTVAAAAGSAVSSAAWGGAAIALAELESARSEAMIALADLDALYVAARTEGTPSESIAQARDQVISLISAQDQTLNELRGSVAS